MLFARAALDKLQLHVGDAVRNSRGTAAFGRRHRSAAAMSGMVAFACMACSSGPATKADLCASFEHLGTEMLSPHPFSNSGIFTAAGELGDRASSYQGNAAVAQEGPVLKAVKESGSTSIEDLMNATTAIAGVCGHPLGIGG